MATSSDPRRYVWLVVTDDDTPERVLGWLSAHTATAARTMAERCTGRPVRVQRCTARDCRDVLVLDGWVTL